MINLLQIYWSHLKSSKKAIFVSLIGLIFALAILSGSILYINTRKADIINEVLDPNNQSPFGIEIELQTHDVNISFDNLNTGLNTIGNNLVKAKHVDFLSSFELFSSIQGLSIPSYTVTYNYTLQNWVKAPTTRLLDIVQLNDNIIKDLSQFLNANSTLPSISGSNSSYIQGFLLATYFGPSTDPQLQITKNTMLENYVANPLTEITQFMTNATFSISHQIPLNVTGYGKAVNFDTYSVSQRKSVTNYNRTQFPTLSKFFGIVPQNLNIGTSFLFVRNLTQVLSKFTPLFYDSSLQRNVYGITENIDGGYVVNFNKFDAFAINSKIDQMNSLSKVLANNILNSEIYQTINPSTTVLNVYFTDYGKLGDVSTIVYQIFYEMLLYAVPMLIVALLVTNYSFGLIQKRVISQVGVYKTRGATSLSLFVFQLLDYIIIVLISAFLGMLMGIPLTNLVAKTNGLLNFSNPQNYDVLASFLNTLPFLLMVSFAASIVLSFLTNFRRMVKLSRMTIYDSEVENAGEKGAPFWQTHYFDVIIFFYGVGTYLLINYYLYSPSTNASILSSGLFFLLLFYPTPFAIILGTILLANRFIPGIIDFIGRNLWKFKGGLLAFSFKNVIRHRQSSTRAIILITSLLTFLILFYTIPQSQIAYQRQTTEYNYGADAQLVFHSNFITRASPQKYINSFTTSLENSYAQYLKGITPVITASYYSSSNQKTFKFIFIDPSSYLSGSSVSLFNLGLSNSLTNDLLLLNSNSSNNHPVLVQKNFLNARNVQRGQGFTLDLLGESHQFTILDTFNEWPMGARTVLDYNTFYFVMDINYFYTNILNYIYSTPYIQAFSAYILMNFKDTQYMHEITTQMSLETGLQVNEANINLEWWTVNTQLLFKFRLGQINIDLLVSLAISITILLMFAYMQLIERRQEIFTERALGMKLKQIAFIFYIETILLLIIGLILASFISVYFLNTLSIFATGGLNIPRYNFLIPYDLVFSTYILLIIIASVCAVIPAYYVSRQDIIRAFSSEN